jgi:hypothetical protein
MKKEVPARTLSSRDVYISGLAVFLVSFLYFIVFGNYALYFLETQTIFLYKIEYLKTFLAKPGGLLEYLAKFITQFYAGRIEGSLLISLLIALPSLTLYRINRLLIKLNSFSWLLLTIPPVVLLLMHAWYFHTPEYVIGFNLLLLYYLFAIKADTPAKNVWLLAFYPFFYYAAGTFALIFTVLYTFHHLFSKRAGTAYKYPVFLLLVALTTILIFWKLILLQPFALFLLSPFPLLESSVYSATVISLTAFLIIYPLIARYTADYKNTRRLNWHYSLASVILISGAGIVCLFSIYDQQTRRVIELERYSFRGEYQKAAELHEKKPSLNLIGQYFYNYALSESGQLCERLFEGRQDFLAGSLVLPWGDVHLNRGAYFYYAVGLINEAHRWAYEEMVVFGYRPQNLQILAKTSLINGDLRMARKYLALLKKTLYYRKWAIDYEKLADDPSQIEVHPELGEKIKLLPSNNFFIQFNEPQNNLPYILEGQPGNKKAIEYYIAGLLLTKKVELAVNTVKDLKASGYTSIPRHLEEAILIYYDSTKEFPDFGGLRMNPSTLARFDQYRSTYMAARSNPATVKQVMEERFGNTFWYYFHFK